MSILPGRTRLLLGRSTIPIGKMVRAVTCLNLPGSRSGGPSARYSKEIRQLDEASANAWGPSVMFTSDTRKLAGACD